MLSVKNLNIYLKKDLKMILEDFNFNLSLNDKIAIIGKEGNGKSTLLKAIYDENLVKDYVEINGEINKKNEIIAYLFQENSEDYLKKSALEIIYDIMPLENFDYNLYYKYLNYFDIDDELIENNKEIKSFSGGERIKFNLLICMLKNPTVLFLDEPSNDLDLKSLKLLEKFIKELDIPVIFISHDEYLLKNCSNGIIHFEVLPNGKTRYTVSKSSYEEYVSNREYLITRQNQKSKKEKEEFDKKMDKYRQVYNKVEYQLRVVSRSAPAVAKNLKDKMHTIKAMGKRMDKQKENLTPQAVTETEINLSFSENVGLHNKTILNFKLDKLEVENKILSENIELNIKAKDKICIIGDNGVGKTTLLKKIVEEFKNSNVDYFYMPQNYENSLEFEKSPIEFLSKKYTKEEHTKISTYLGSLNYSREEMTRPISSLSGGQKCELFFAKMILGEYDFIILDEPTRNLSPISSEKIRKSLREYKGGILAVSHDLAFIETVFDDVYYMSKKGLNLTDLK